ncbi:MAG: VWA domain-containing protein [Clostridium beijerinckii]
MSKIKNKKSFFKKVSCLICFMLLVVLINVNLKSVNAVDATLPTQPTFDITMKPITPNPAMVNQDITVSGTIKPNQFESDIPKKQIVLVLDVSGSMSGKALCTNQRGEVEISIYEVLYYEFWGFNVVYRNRHYYIEDYCQEHGKVGEHQVTSGNTKIKQLKIAADNFIDTIKSKNISNLEVAIVAFSNNATINSASQGTNFIPMNSDANIKNVKDIIDGLQASGGTNTGEGLRKAEYLLEHGDSNASKSIIFMSDGQPTFYSVKSNNTDTYTNIDTSDPNYLGSGSEYDENAKKYATQIGAIIKQQKANIFSIGYGLGVASSTGNLTMQDIHKSMGGSLTDGSFFATDVGAIDGVFSSIADKIISSYTITNVKINLNLNENFTLNIGGNTVNINNIVYTLTSQSNGKYIYTAPSIDFSFTIKGTIANVYDNIFQNSQLVVPWNGGTKTTDIPKTGVTVKSSGLPDIEAKKTSLEGEPYQVGKDINVTYTVIPESFNFQSSNTDSAPKDVVILLDVSNAMNGKLDAVKQAINNKILHDDELKTSRSRYSIITYSDNATYYKLNGNDTDVITKCVSEASYADLMKEKILYNQAINVSSSNNRNITNALALAQNILDNGRDNLDKLATSKIDVGRSGGSKNIIIIGGGSITDIGSTSLTTQINNIRSKNYNIITFNTGEVIAQNEEPNNNLKSLHYNLIGKQGNSLENILEKENNNYYIDVDYRQFDSNDPHKLFLDSHNMNNNTIEYPVMYKIGNKLKGGVTQSYTFKAKLKFNKGDKFNVVSGLNSCSDGNYNVETDEFNVVYTLKNGSYSAEPFDISFKIQPNDTGTLEFGNPGFISYTNLENELTGNSVEPFLITVSSPIKILQHGLYEGIKNSLPSIDNSKSYDFIKGSNIKLGATLSCTISSSDSESVRLEIPKEIKPTSEIKVFTYNDIGQLTPIGIMKESLSDENNIIYKYNGESVTDKKILIVYDEKIPDSALKSIYVNRLYAGNSEQDVTLNITDELPDLF